MLFVINIGERDEAFVNPELIIFNLVLRRGTTRNEGDAS
jgi:hypothetical protein